MIYLVTHTDLDGIGPEVIMGTILPKDEFKVFPAEAYEVNEKVDEVINLAKEGDNLYIVDCAPSADMMDILNQLPFEKHLFDHHSPKFDTSKYSWACVDAEGRESGTSLFANYLNYEYKEFVDLIRRWDTWEWTKTEDDLEPKRLNMLLQILGREKFVEHCCDALNQGKPVLDEIARSLIYYKEKEIERYIELKVKQGSLINIDNIPCAYVMCESYKSEVATALMKEFNVSMSAVIGTEGVSLRSVGDINVGEIAKKFGGGGRMNTAGFRISPADKYEYINKIFNFGNNDKTQKMEII